MRSVCAGATMGPPRLVAVARLFFVLNVVLIGSALCNGRRAVLALSPLATTSVPAPSASTNYSFNLNQFEADAMNAVLQRWTKLNPELTTILHWSPERHPCDNFTAAAAAAADADMGETEFEGAWLSVDCLVVVTNVSGYVNYDVSLYSLSLHPSDSRCRGGFYADRCGFDGIVGELPPEIGNLTNLLFIDISNNPKLTGPLPIEVLRMPSLFSLQLRNNSLSGSLPSIPSWNCNLYSIDLSFNQLDGPVDLQMLNNTCGGGRILYLNNNYLSGSFSFGSQFDVSYLDISNNDFTSIKFGNYTESTVYTPSLRNLSMYNNKLGGMFPIGFSQMPSLQSLYFQNNNFIGEVPPQIFKSSGLQILNGDKNHFDTLILPDIEFGSSNLTEIILTNNEISQLQYSDKGAFQYNNLQYSSLLFLGGNPLCTKIETPVLSIICRFNKSSQIRGVIQKSDTKEKVIIGISTSAACAFLLLVMVVYAWRLVGKIKSLGVILKEFEKKEVKPNLYSYKEIKLATNNFDKNNMLGVGAFGEVYKGVLYDGTIVAVKKLTLSSNQVLSEFLNEVIVISGLKHRNLVKLKGCCLGDGDQRILVFEFLENKNLAEALWLQDKSRTNIETPHLDWSMRFNIILGIARGLAYLHEDLQPPVIHRDIKATNILLDKNYNAKIADFGLAYLFPLLESEASHLTLMHVAGTRGYLSPEYALHGHVSTSLDVYSLGIVILEILSGRKSIDFQKSGEEIYLREWAWKLFEEEESITLVDPLMKHSPADLEGILQVLKVALICVHYKVEIRPKMHNVLLMLLGGEEVGDFRRGFEYGEMLEDDSSRVSLALGTTSSFLRRSKSRAVEECSLLNNTNEIEMNEMTF